MKAAILFVLTAICGLSAMILLINGIQKIDVQRQLFSNITIVIGGILIYIILLFLTSHFMHRQATTELLLIIIWGVLVFCEMNTLYGSSIFSDLTAIMGCVVAVVFVIVSMVCYLAYYVLEPMMGYYDGMVPLFFVGIYMAGIGVKMML